MSNKVAESKGIGIAPVLDVFIKHVDSLAETLPLTMVAIQLAGDLTQRAYQKFVSERCEKKEEDGKEVFVVDIPDVHQFSKLEKRLDRIRIANKNVPRSFVVSLVSHYDHFLGKLVKVLFYLKPEMLRASDKVLTLSQLLEFPSIEEAKEFILEKEIETLLRKSHSEQFEWLENRFGIQLRKDLPVWPTFIEVTERRNLFVHAGGVVSNQYIKVCESHGYDVDASLTAGVELGVSKAYFESAYAAIYEIGVKLAHVLWRKLAPSDLEQADKHLSNACYDLLKEEKYTLAKILLDFATITLKKHADSNSRRVFVVNRAQAYKWSGDEQGAHNIIKGEDWSDTSDEFKLAEAVLLNDFGKAATIMKKIGSDGYPSKSSYRDWPLFKEFRQSEEFLTTFEEIFGEPYSQFEKEASEYSLEDIFALAATADDKPASS